jgi:hypothetical protein
MWAGLIIVKRKYKAQHCGKSLVTNRLWLSNLYLNTINDTMTTVTIETLNQLEDHYAHLPEEQKLYDSLMGIIESTPEGYILEDDLFKQFV